MPPDILTLIESDCEAEVGHAFVAVAAEYKGKHPLIKCRCKPSTDARERREQHNSRIFGSVSTVRRMPHRPVRNYQRAMTRLRKRPHNAGQSL